LEVLTAGADPIPANAMQRSFVRLPGWHRVAAQDIVQVWWIGEPELA